MKKQKQVMHPEFKKLRDKEDALWADFGSHLKAGRAEFIDTMASLSELGSEQEKVRRKYNLDPSGYIQKEAA